VTFDSDCLGDTRGALALAHHEPRELSQQQGVVMSEAIRANGGVGLDDWRGPRRTATSGGSMRGHQDAPPLRWSRIREIRTALMAGGRPCGISPEKSPIVEETRRAVWSSKIVPQIVP